MVPEHQKAALPELFLKRMANQMENSMASFLKALEDPSPTSIRLNPSKNFHFLHHTDPIPWCTMGKYLTHRPQFTTEPSFHAGGYYVQEASSMLVEQAFRQHVNLDQSLHVLDLCAAPGGKSTHIISLISSDSLLVANETIRSRASILRENLIKWGHDNVLVTNNDPSAFASIPGYFDVLVVDAPCSGEGLFRKDKNASKEWSLEHVSHCASRQKRILSDCWSTLKAGGILIYATCTYSKEENEENLRWLEARHDVSFLPLTLKPEWGIEAVNEKGIIGYRCYPHQVSGEGFFISIVRKNELSSSFKKKNTPHLPTYPSSKDLKFIAHWIRQPDSKAYYQHNNRISFYPKVLQESFLKLTSNLSVVGWGTSLGTTKRNKIIPDHALALSIHVNATHFPSIELSLEEALRYLRKDPLQIQNGTKGFAMIKHQGLPIGWINALGNRINNLYPSGWRIRMEV